MYQHITQQLRTYLIFKLFYCLAFMYCYSHISHRLQTSFNRSKPIFVITNFIWSLCSMHGLLMSYVQRTNNFQLIKKIGYLLFRFIIIISTIMVVIMLGEAIIMLVTNGYHNNALDGLFMTEIFVPTILWSIAKGPKILGS